MARDTVTETGTAKSERRLPRWSLQRTFTALRYRNYRLWFMGQLSSLIGTWMQTTAQGFLIYQLTNSPAYLGLVGFASGVPSLLFMMYGGVIADRLPRRNLLLVTQGSMMILAFILTTLTFTESVQPWHIIVLSLLLGTANAFDTPARQSFVSELVEREDLGNAIALNSTMFQGAMVVGPAVAGITYALLGPALCFAINGISFLAVLTALLMMRVKATVAPVRVTSAWQDLREGIRYIIAHPIIRTIIALVSLTSIFGMGFNVLFPDWAVVVLGGDATTNGWLQSARGVGSLSGALMIASFGRFKFKGKLLTIGSLVFPFALILFAQVRALPLSLLTLTLVGWSYMSLFNMGNVLIQTHVEDELRGRVMSVYALAFGGLMPLGALLAGTVADQVGSPAAIVAGALITLALAVLVYWQVPNLRALE